MGLVDREAAPPPPPRGPHRHVWVRPSKMYGAMTPWPGLLIEWRKDEGGTWWGLVACIGGGIGNTLTVNWWSAESLIRTHDGRPPDP